MTTPTDEQLVALWRDHGQTSAIADLADRYLGQFYGTARAMLLRPDEAEVVAQETMLKVIRSIGTYNSKWPFRTWTYTILLNTIRTERKRLQVHDKRYRATVVDQAEIEDPSPETIPMNGELQDCIEDALRKLTEKQRTAVVLMLIEGLTASEAAKIEGCSVDAIYQRVAEARKSLRSEPSLQQFWIDTP